MASALRSLTRSPVKRSVHLHISPRPSTLAESAAIMRVMSQFGEIECYKSFKHDTLSSPKTAVVIFREEHAAADCLRGSPVRFHLCLTDRPQQVTLMRPADKPSRPMIDRTAPKQAVVTKKDEELWDKNEERGAKMLERWGLNIDFAAESAPKSRYSRAANLKDESQSRVDSVMKDAVKSEDMGYSQADPEAEIVAGSSTEIEGDAPGTRAFSVMVSPAHINFREHINNSRFANPFSIDTKTAAQRDLIGRVPHAGLSDIDWRAEVPWRYVERIRTKEREDPNRRTLRELYDETMTEQKARNTRLTGS